MRLPRYLKIGKSFDRIQALLSTFEEAIRFESPVQTFFRTASIGGVECRA